MISVRDFLIFSFVFSFSLFGLNSEKITGENIFKSKCTPCHSVGSKTILLPGVKVISKNSSAWLIKFMMDTEPFIAKFKPEDLSPKKSYNGIKKTSEGFNLFEIKEALEFLSAHK